MNILHVIPYFSPAYAYGGPPTSVFELCTALTKRGHEVTVLTTDALSSTRRYPERHVSNGLHVYYQRNLSNYLAWHHQVFFPLGANKFLRQRLKQYDIAHLHMYRTYQNILVRRQALRARIPYVFSAHGTVPRIVRKRLAKAVFDRVVGQRVLEDASMVTALSKAEVVEYETMGVPTSKITIVPNGIDDRPFAALPVPGTFKHKYGIERKRMVSYVGRLNVRKGIETLIRAFRQLVETMDDLVLVLVGPDDGYRWRVEQLIKHLGLGSSVVVTGLITMPQKLEVFVDSDVVVYPGAFEFFGLVPFEALMCKRPVIVSDDSGCGEIVRGENVGLTVPFGDVRALAEAITETLEGGTGIRERTQRGHKFVREKLNWNAIAARMSDVYDRCILEADGHPRRP